MSLSGFFGFFSLLLAFQIFKNTSEVKFYCLYNFIIQILHAPSNILGLNVVSQVNLLQKKIQVYYLEYF